MTVELLGALGAGLPENRGIGKRERRGVKLIDKFVPGL